MIKKIKLLVLLGILLSLIGCEEDEPKVTFCAITSLTECTCYPLGNEITKPIKECLGHITVDPKAFAEMAVHHKEIHDEILWCE